MVTATAVPGLIQIRFPAPEEPNSSAAAGTRQIVVYARIAAGRLKIYYSHYVVLTREGDAGEYTERSRYRVDLTPALQYYISQAAMLELWSYLTPAVEVLPGPVLGPLTEVVF